MRHPSLTRRLYLLLIIALGAGVVFGAPQTPAYAANKTFTVNSSVDAPDATPGDGTCETVSGNGICTLRAAIQEANAHAGADTVTLQAGTTYALTRGGNDDNALNGDLDITDDLIISRTGASNATIDANLTDRIFDIHKGTTTISGVTMTHGSAHEGGAIQNTGTLTLNNSAVTGSTAYSYGGGIYNYGTLTLNNSLVSGNSDIGPTANGGGIYNGSSLNVVNSTISGNTADGGGGGLANMNTAILANSTINGNNAPFGGGIRNGYHLTLTQSTVSGNTATSLGGGFHNEGNGVAIITSSTLNGNTSLSGGGVENQGLLTVTASTLSGNKATAAGAQADGGALSNYYGTVALTNSTLTVNTARRNGGALSNDGGTISLSNVTIYANLADADHDNVGAGGGIYNANTVGNVVNIKNSIAAGNWRSFVGGATVQDCSGWLDSGDYNLFQNVVSCNFNGTTTHNKIAGPVLGQLQNNGGPTQTNALNPGSPAIDAGNPSGCTDTSSAPIATDQRGYARPSGAACDIGAFEAGATPPKQDQTIIFGQLPNQMATAAPFQINATASSGLKIDFSAAGKCSVSASSLNQGLSSATVTLSGQGGNCTITAHQTGNATYNAAPDVARTFAITTQTQTISFAPLPSKTLGDPPFTVSATASSGLPVFFTPDTPAVCDVVGDTVTLKASGICGLQASQDGNNQFAPAPNALQSFAVLDPAKKAQTISFAPLPNRQVGEAPFNISASASSGLPVGFSTATFAVCQVGAGKVTVMAAGICTIIAQQDGNATFNPAPVVTRSFVVVDPFKQAQTITFASLPNKTIGDAPFSVSATASSGLPVDLSSSTPDACTVSGNLVTMATAGTCTIVASQSGNATYNAAEAQRMFTISKHSQTIAFAPLPNKTAGDAPFPVSASASSGLPVTFTASGQCSVSGATIALLGAGQCTIIAHQSGDASFKAAQDKAQTFLISGSAQNGGFVLYLPLVVR